MYLKIGIFTKKAKILLKFIALVNGFVDRGFETLRRSVNFKIVRNNTQIYREES